MQTPHEQKESESQVGVCKTVQRTKVLEVLGSSVKHSGGSVMTWADILTTQHGTSSEGNPNVLSVEQTQNWPF